MKAIETSVSDPDASRASALLRNPAAWQRARNDTTAPSGGKGSAIVVGSGIAGLTAAYRMHQAGMQVTVLEANGVVGGRMGDRRVGDIAFNSGARLVYPFGSAFNRLIADLSLHDVLIPLRHLTAQCVSPSGSHTIELMPSVRSLATPGLPMRERFALVSHALRMRAQRSRVDPDWAISAIADDPAADRQTLAEYVRDAIGPQALSSMIEPVFRSTRSFNPETLSALFYRSTVPHLIGEDTVYTLKGGMGCVCQALAGRLDVRTNAPVASIETMRDAVPDRRDGAAASTENVAARGRRCAVTLSDGTVLTADHVVCATEGSLAGALVRNPQREEREMLQAVRYNALGVVHYGFSQPLPPTMQFALRGAPGRISTFQQLPAAPANGRPLTQIYCQLTPEAAGEAERRGLTDNLDVLLRDELRARIPGFDRHVSAVVNQWIPRKLPVFAPGYGERLQAFWRWQENAAHNAERPVVYCGDWTSQALLTGACASGERAARIVLSRTQN
ncbi:FAD dependent oxidoreductase family protein [Paraburkholderia xenovorans LB400]|uniref:Amine oxidase n=1 Tax=Paraburkholderia xenovorans (strain LB400) TaxID=266265 RepID=Q13G10_PARXL|nr:NAD(P)/FAD-dependent oxidoreductase [Paraburkholderia xenovorans]ABE36979.1 Putative amine oxidase [Paraburkholderia xenovorans LB400]AIP35174.1 FAD dependent oxidoreductase family protein [Paraburkholderia xenovorans LB400]